MPLLSRILHHEMCYYRKADALHCLITLLKAYGGIFLTSLPVKSSRWSRRIDDLLGVLNLGVPKTEAYWLVLAFSIGNWVTDSS